MSGKIDWLSENKKQTYGAGTHVKVDPKAKYLLKNNSNDECSLHFLAY